MLRELRTRHQRDLISLHIALESEYPARQHYVAPTSAGAVAPIVRGDLEGLSLAVPLGLET